MLLNPTLMADLLPTAALRAALQTYLNGESGIQFSVLARFAEPLFELYDVDPRAGIERGREHRDAAELATLLAVLETARVLWAYFSLEPTAAEEAQDRLQAILVGQDVSQEANEAFLAFLSLMATHWYGLADEERAGALVPGFSLPPFHHLVEQYREKNGEPESRAGRFGPDELELTDALALFARPLLEDERTLADPDALERALTRASAYWDLAQASPACYEEQLSLVVLNLSGCADERAQLEHEARRMVMRYRELFHPPEHSP
jgi:hypothetical protein